MQQVVGGLPMLTAHEERVHTIRQHLEAVQDLTESARLEAMKARNAAEDEVQWRIDESATLEKIKAAEHNAHARLSELAHIERIAEALRVAGYVI